VLGLNLAARPFDQLPDGMIQLVRRDPVSTRSSILALAAVATVATAALASTSASAKPIVMGLIIKPHPVMGVVIPPSKPVLGVIIKPPHPIPGVVINPHPIMGVIVHRPDDDDDEHHSWWHHHHRPWLIEGSEPMQVSAPVTTAPTAPCTCLTKNYLEDGSVLFKDVCTKEAAMATPDELKAQMQGARP
jgi:hypothetical protein